MNLYQQYKTESEKQETPLLVDTLIVLKSEKSLDEKKRAAKAAISDVIESREGVEFVNTLERSLQAVSSQSV